MGQAVAPAHTDQGTCLVCSPVRAKRAKDAGEINDDPAVEVGGIILYGILGRRLKRVHRCSWLRYSMGRRHAPTEGFVPQSIPALMHVVIRLCKADGSQALKKSIWTV
jgi:hypothetical protein